VGKFAMKASIVAFHKAFFERNEGLRGVAESRVVQLISGAGGQVSYIQSFKALPIRSSDHHYGRIEICWNVRIEDESVMFAQEYGVVHRVGSHSFCRTRQPLPP
jgi:hypothetical protein